MRPKETVVTSLNVTVCVVALVGVVSSGCQTRPSESGRSRFQVLDPPPSTASSASDKRIVQTENLIDYIPGHIKRPFSLPVYPPNALAAHAGAFEVTVSVTVDESGRVSDVVRSLRGLSLPSRFADDFFNAVKAAIMGWTFEPSHQVYY